ncbi:uncharacterized protein LOC129005949 isoform X2 [Macrosteles quadrilineatus]|uniref:uncharacterized protein LOC129005949 isoform X2 n=1 Tax=Macrosteles quadrilineatus TaxID=74068 RepID=UPI0023E32960|nr:uncharacterized protein LOC129005949 isoform X2 [Macrosteles quadrilineatus]
MRKENCILHNSWSCTGIKTWKTRWCVMRKLSPVADCLHLQLYRDSKDRYKQGQTKASLSLQHFLGVYSGFTLDKESNTIAIICQDVTVVLAFDTRERLIQWQVKIANNLGEDEQWLVQISSAPPRAKVSPGPARLHLQEHRFCLTVGVPPRLLGHWQIRQLRRYGLVENKFCFEGGSSCGKGEGLYVLVTDQGENITRAFKMAAEGRLAVRRRPLARNMSVMTSPRRSRLDPRVSDLSCLDARSRLSTADSSVADSRSHDSLLGWPSAELWSDSSSVFTYAQKPSSWREREREAGELERCSSCIGKLGVLSRSSTLTTNYGERRQFTNAPPSVASNYDRTTVSSLDYWNPRSSTPGRSRAGSVTVGRSSTSTPANCTLHISSPAYSNYDVPKPHITKVELGGGEYDTPRSIKESLPPQWMLQTTGPEEPCLTCGKTAHHNTVARTSVVVEKDDSHTAMCPCQRVMCWAGSWMRLPYLLTGAFRANTITGTTIHKVKLDGEGKMPFVNCRGENYTCETSNNNQMNQSISKGVQDEVGECIDSDLKNSKNQYANIKVTSENAADNPEVVIQEPKSMLPYANLEFAKSLEYYENSRELMQKKDAIKNNAHNGLENISDVTSKSCTKCGHAWRNLPPKPGPKNDDYLIMEPATNHSTKLRSQPSSPLQSPVHEKFSQSYLPMLPLSGKAEELQHFRLRQLNEKSQSTPSLPIPRRKSFTNPSIHGSSGYHCMSETSSPYVRRRLMTTSTLPPVRKDLLIPSIRKRSSSMDSSRYLDNLESIEEKVVSPTQTLVNTPTISNATSIDSLSDISLNQRPIPTSSSEHVLSRVDNSEYVSCKSSLRVLIEEQPSKALVESSSHNIINSPIPQIKRSASIPCKTVYNRDSSSSNDSGVSTGSLQFRRRDLMELDFCSRKRSVPEKLKIVKENTINQRHVIRKSKSVDPFEDMNFEFEEMKPPVKSSSAGASVPVCTTHTDAKGYLSPGGVPYIDSHSTSSGTSDMSDYIETLSLSSYTSSDTPDSLQLNHTTINTMRPRSGKEYHTIDRFNLKPQISQTSGIKTCGTINEMQHTNSP